MVLAVLAGTYQPVQFGDAYSGTFPGLPAATGLRIVNDLGNAGQLYVPPQAGVFTVAEGLDNTGPQAVTIEAVSILSPQAQADAARGIAPWPLVPAGTVAWRLMSAGSAVKGLTSGTSVAGLSLAPGEPIMVGIPVRMSGACYDPSGWTGIDAVYVQVRFGLFTHWVTVRFQPSFLLHSPATRGMQPVKDFRCLAGTGK